VGIAPVAVVDGTFLEESGEPLDLAARRPVSALITPTLPRSTPSTSTAAFRTPYGTVRTPSDDLIIADAGNARYRRIDG